MQIQLLLNILKNGYSYKHTNAEGNTQQELVAPNKHTIQAHAVIVKLIQDNEALLQNTFNLQNLLDQTLADLTNAKAHIQSNAGVSSNADVPTITEPSSN